jgi:hypothetical protein
MKREQGQHSYFISKIEYFVYLVYGDRPRQKTGIYLTKYGLFRIFENSKKNNLFSVYRSREINNKRNAQRSVLPWQDILPQQGNIRHIFGCILNRNPV